MHLGLSPHAPFSGHALTRVVRTLEAQSDHDLAHVLLSALLELGVQMLFSHRAAGRTLFRTLRSSGVG